MSSSATVRVEKATSELLIAPDWTMNIDICDSVNSNSWDAKDVVKAVKKRLQHKNPKVQLLALTLLETMVKNCGDYIHFQIVEKNILQEMSKIVKKKTDMHVRDKILFLLDSWQEAFGGPGGKHPEYYWAYEELRRSGVEFPRRSSNVAPIFTPPLTHPGSGNPQAGFGMPSNSSRRLDEAMASEAESLSSSKLDSMKNVMEVLSDMLQAVNPNDRMAIKDEVIVDLVAQCRDNKKKLMQMLSSTGDEELLGLGLELNDSLQTLLTKHDAIASGSPLPTPVTSLSPRANGVGGHSPTTRPTQGIDLSPQANGVGGYSSQPAEAGGTSTRVNTTFPKPIVTVTRSQVDEDEEEEDDFAQLARRHTKSPQTPSKDATSVNDGTPKSLTPTPFNALALPDPPAPVKTTKEQDMIDLLSITLSTTSVSPQTPYTPPPPQPQPPAPSTTQAYPYVAQPYPGYQGQVYNNYVVPWAQPQPQLQPPPQPQPIYPQYSSAYPPPPWAATPGYSGTQNSTSPRRNTISTQPTNTNASNYMPMQGMRPLQHFNSFQARESNGSTYQIDSRTSVGPRIPGPAAVQKPFVPSYRLFEDLNVLGSADGRQKITNNNTSGGSSRSMVGGRK